VGKGVGEGVAVSVGVLVGVGVSVGVEVEVGVGVAVQVGTRVRVGVGLAAPNRSNTPSVKPTMVPGVGVRVGRRVLKGAKVGWPCGSGSVATGLEFAESRDVSLEVVGSKLALLPSTIAAGTTSAEEAGVTAGCWAIFSAAEASLTGAAKGVEVNVARAKNWRGRVALGRPLSAWRDTK
jgi:hypothetical protein